MFNSGIFLPVIIITGIAYSILAKKLTVLAALTGGILACLIYIAAGYAGVAMMSMFFILGSAATSWKKHKKQAFTTREETNNGRNVLQVLANAGAAGIASVVILFYPQFAYVMFPAMAAAFASATADTLSSELGMVYGRRFFNIISFRPDYCGLDGVISLEGTLIGIGGSCIIAVIYALGYGWDFNFYFIVIAGTVGNLTDSILGAILERKGIIGNDMVNFLNTLTAVLVVLILEGILG
ncbi:DUF92 domain-containing protein [Pedobacter riviphilus]|uniref:DUF92 domain-containing protein n=1 Tax=Pedobacter riviphilus TaxID=2766984 RepID=A0ABX6TLP2_9SPHI|nr:DUF92 domain-containing protein [Pedobacter riviphilus]QNR86192.1 DUF92 domain-containing protein [Pedobacter riviphilus]